MIWGEEIKKKNRRPFSRKKNLEGPSPGKSKFTKAFSRKKKGLPQGKKFEKASPGKKLQKGLLQEKKFGEAIARKLKIHFLIFLSPPDH